MFDINDMIYGRANLTRSGGSALTHDTTDSNIAGYATAAITVGRAGLGRQLWLTAIVEKAGTGVTDLVIHLDLTIDGGSNYITDIATLTFEAGFQGAKSVPVNYPAHYEEVSTPSDIKVLCRVTAASNAAADDWDRVVVGLTIAPTFIYGRDADADTFGL